MLKELLEIKKEMEPVIHEANVKLNVLAREVISPKKRIRNLWAYGRSCLS